MPLAKWVQIAQVFGSVSALATLAAVVIGAVVGLRRYRRDLRLKAADLLLKMEEEYRAILPTCFKIEVQYAERLKGELEKEAKGEELTGAEADAIGQLDRCLRFFYLCTVLHSDLNVEENAIARAYYYYVSVFAKPGERPELNAYLQKYYRRLGNWMDRHQPCLDHYRETGEWNAKLAKKV